ncbi:hypothetical protein [Duganella sp. P38]|uniref:hypothetical protein n=1 Tax=Duganella sp. P38 TaxID=3423949 RepID=UPI003D7AA8AD
MRRLALLGLCGSLAASPASAMRARQYIDADQRAPVALAQDQRAPLIAIAQQPPGADLAQALRLPPPEETPLATAPLAASPVPEPSGYVMLGWGLLLLLLRPHGREGAAIAAKREKPARL